MNEIFFDPAPCNEECVQAGTAHYGERSRAQAAVYIRQLKRLFPIPPELAERVKYVMKMNAHDSADYLDIRLQYWGIPAAEDYAMQVEDGLPEHWDEQAQVEMVVLQQQWAEEGVPTNAY